MTDLHLPSLEGVPALQQVLGRALAYFLPDRRIVGLIVGGSIARGGLDRYSDIDLWIVTRGEDFAAVFAERDRAAEAIGQPLLRFIADHNPGGDHDYIVTYNNLVKLDLIYYTAAQMVPHWKWTTCLIFKDSDGLIARIQAQSQHLPPALPSAEALIALNQKFWIWCWSVFGKLLRGEWWETLDGIHTIRSLALLPMLAWIEHYPHEGYRRLERKAASYQELLAATVAELQPESLYAALQAEIALFTSLRDVLFARLAVPHDRTAESLVIETIAQRWTEQTASTADTSELSGSNHLI